MAGNDIDHLKQQRAKLHHIRRFRAIVASPPPQVVVEGSTALSPRAYLYRISVPSVVIGATCARDLDLHPHMLATRRGSWQPTLPLAPGEMHGPTLALAISARFAALHESLCGTQLPTFALQRFRQLTEGKAD
jgi:hypothetical protein